MDLSSHIQALHASGWKAVLAVTGGGGTAVSQLLAVPGASRFVLEATVPYNANALIDFLGRRPEHFCSAETVMMMAERALDRARRLAPGESVLGLGCTATLATDRPKKGDHRFFIAVAREQIMDVEAVILQKGARDRPGEEEVLDRRLLNLLAEHTGVSSRLPVDLLPGDQTSRETRNTAAATGPVFCGALDALCIHCDGRVDPRAKRPALVMPGSYNPIHEGHRLLAAVAERITGLSLAYELSIVNVDKPPLGYEEIRRRLAQFHWLAPVWITRAPLFTAKAELFPSATFVIGADTAVRLVDPHYYGDNPANMLAGLESIRAHGCRFLVAGRPDASGRFVALEDLSIPPQFREMFQGIPRSDYECSLSSTTLRG